MRTFSESTFADPGPSSDGSGRVGSLANSEPSSFVSEPTHVLEAQVDRAERGVPPFDLAHERLDVDWLGAHGSLQTRQNLSVQAAAVANRCFLECSPKACGHSV